MDYDELVTYNGDTQHDMWVDFTYHENTGELTDEFAVKTSMNILKRLGLK